MPFLPPKGRAALPREEEQGSESQELPELFAGTLPHPGQSPDIGSRSTQEVSIP